MRPLKTLVPLECCDVYFSCSMAGQNEEIRRGNSVFGRALQKACERWNLRLYDPEARFAAGVYNDSETIFGTETAILRQCKVMVMYIDTPSCGAGAESMVCHYEDIPIILVSRNPDALSRFVLGNTQVDAIITYRNCEQAIEEVEECFADIFSKRSAISA